MSVYSEAAENFAKDLEEEFGSDYTIEQLLRFQCQDLGLISPSRLNDYGIRKEFLKLLKDQEGKARKEKLSRMGVQKHLATIHNRSWQGIYLLTCDCK